ncbi:hypothetical protein Dimus_000359 [Dionaea muscipula]
MKGLCGWSWPRWAVSWWSGDDLGSVPHVSVVVGRRRQRWIASHVRKWNFGGSGGLQEQFPTISGGSAAARSDLGSVANVSVVGGR